MHADHQRPPGTIRTNEAWRRRLAVLALLAGLGHLVIRADTLGTGATLVLSLVLLVTEVWALAELALLAVNAWATGDRRSSSPVGDGSEPSDLIDVVVIADGATIDEVERTLIGTTALTGRGTVSVIDSRSRPVVAAAVDRFPADYLVDPEVADGGLHRLGVHSGTELVLWLRAGQVSMPELLSTLAPRFEDPDLAVCQSSVEPLNAQSLVHLRGGRDDDALLRQVTGPGRDRSGVAPWTGPGSIVRRAAIETIVPQQVVGPGAVGRALIRLFAAGWRTGYDGNGMVKEVAADTLGQYLDRRRARAADVWVRVVGGADGLATRGLSWRQRAALLGDVALQLRGARYLLQALVLLAVLTTGRLPVAELTVTLIASWLITLITATAARRGLSGGAMAIGDWVRHGWRTVETDLRALGDVVGGHWHRASEHAGRRGGGVTELGRLWLLTATVLAIDAAVIGRALTLIDLEVLPPMDRAGQVATVVFAIGLLVPLVDVLQVVVGGRQRRAQHRVTTSCPITVFGTETTTVDLSPAGVGALFDEAPAVGATSPFVLTLAGRHGSTDSVTGTLAVRAVAPHDDGRVRVGMEFEQLRADDRLAVVAFCALGRQVDRNVGPSGIAVPAQLPIERSSGHRHGLQLMTMLAMAAGVTLVLQAPVAAVTAVVDTAPVGTVCVVHTSGAPVVGAVVVQTGTAAEPAPTTPTDTITIEVDPTIGLRLPADTTAESLVAHTNPPAAALTDGPGMAFTDESLVLTEGTDSSTTTSTAPVSTTVPSSSTTTSTAAVSTTVPSSSTTDTTAPVSTTTTVNPIEWITVGPTGADGCVAVDGLADGYGVDGVDGVIADGIDDGGSMILRLPGRRISVLDRSGLPVVGTARYHTGSWQDAPSIDGGWSIASDSAPTHVEIMHDGARLVTPLADTDADLTVRLATVLADPGADIVAISRGGAWTHFTGGEVLPGRIALRLGDGSVIKLMVADGTEVMVPSGTVHLLP